MNSLEGLLAAIAEDLDPSDAERQAVERAFVGEPVEPGGALIRAEVLRRLCMNAGLVRGGQIGRLHLTKAKIDGDLDLTGLQLDFGLTFEECELHRLGLVDTRLVSLELIGGKAARIEADRVEIAHDLVMTRGFRCGGGTLLRSASIGGDLNCSGGCFLGRANGASLFLDGARVGGRLYLRRQVRRDEAHDFRANHGVLARNARIAGGVICEGGIFEREVDFTRTQVQGDFSLYKADIGAVPSKDSKPPDAELRLGSMQIAGELSLRHTDFHGPSVTLMRTRVDGSLRWKLKRTEPRSRELKVDLTQAQVGYLHDDLDRWHGAEVVLDGFSLGGIAVSGDSWVEERKSWLRSQPDKKWSPHPYDQVRAALRDSGHETKARDIAVEREDMRLERGGLSRLGREVHRAYGVLLGYGYKPLRFFVISALIVLACAAVFWTIPTCDLPSTATQCGGFAAPGAGAAHYNPLLFSLDSFLPVDLGQAGPWHPRDAAFAYLVAIETSIGWLFAALLLGAVTGVLRRD